MFQITVHLEKVKTSFVLVKIAGFQHAQLHLNLRMFIFPISCLLREKADKNVSRLLCSVALGIISINLYKLNTRHNIFD